MLTDKVTANLLMTGKVDTGQPGNIDKLFILELLKAKYKKHPLVAINAQLSKFV
jgi:hypothetical protein